jgi:hypothetical protein
MRKITKITNGLGDYDPVRARPSGLNKKIESTNLCEALHGRNSRVPVLLSDPVPKRVLTLALRSTLSALGPDLVPVSASVPGPGMDPAFSPQLAPDPDSDLYRTKYLKGKAAWHSRLPRL